MLAEGIAFVALRKRSLYEAQVPDARGLPHPPRDATPSTCWREGGSATCSWSRTPFCVFATDTDFAQMRQALADAKWQTTFPVLDGTGGLVGLVNAASVGLLSPDNPVHADACAGDLMQPAASLDADDDLRKAAEQILSSGFRQLPVLGSDRTIVGLPGRVRGNPRLLEPRNQAKRIIVLTLSRRISLTA